MGEIGDWEQTGLGDWERHKDGRGWARHGEPGGESIAVTRRGANFEAWAGRGWCHWFACPDAAREDVDAHLVSHGRLPSAQAFVRLGDWEERNNGRSLRPTSVWIRKRGGQPTYIASDDAERERLDVFLVGADALDPSRAFKEPPKAAGGTVSVDWGGKTTTFGSRSLRDELASNIREQQDAVIATVAGPTGFSAPLAVVGVTGAAAPAWSYPGPGVRTTVAPCGVKATWGEWERIGDAFVRRPSDRGAVPVAAYVDRWELGGNRQEFATDIDDAREKADAYLVARGELEAGRAFKRAGDWEVDVIDYMRQYRPSERYCVKVIANGWFAFSVSEVMAFDVKGPETGDAGKAAADAELVRRGLLAGERAFKVAQPKPKPLAWDAGGGVTAVTGLAFGNAVPTTAVGIDRASAHGDTTAVVVNKRADGVNEIVGYAQDTAKVSDDEINAMYGKHSEVAMALIGAKRFAEQGRATTVVSGDGKPLGTYYAITPDDIKRAEERIAAKQTVTLANWERCLPRFLNNAPREFRDGFNRRQGPAWEAYLRALAWVKEQIQCKRVGTPSARAVITMAALTAQGYLGPAWVKANVREPLVAQWDDIPSGGIRTLTIPVKVY